MTFTVAQGHWCNGALQQATYNFLLAFHHNHVSMLYHYGDIFTYLQKN